MGTLKQRLHRLKLILAYRQYHRFLQRYAHLRKDSPRACLVEIGCGAGYLLHLLQQWFPRCEVIGLDYDFRLLDIAGKQAPSSRLVRGNAQDLPFEDGKLDVILALHLVEHLYWPDRFAREAQRTLKPDGLLVLATPNPKGLGAFVMKSGWGGYRQDHVSLQTPEEWAQMFEKHGFATIRAGTTMLSGIPAFRRFPLALLNYVPLILFGMLPWRYGEAFVGMFRRKTEL